MTDQPQVDDDEGAGFHIVPDAELYLRLERRVGELERAGGGDSGIGQLLQELNDRLGRHRGELDELKRRYNALADLVRLHLTMFTAPSAPATVPESHL